MSNEGVIELALGDDVAIIRINRVDARNSLTLAQIERLRSVLQEAMTSSARCLMLTGTGDAFCAGRDLKEAAPQSEDTYGIMSSSINPLLQMLRSSHIPTVAAVQGPALGLGLGLALACDVTLAAETATFGSPFRHFGGVLDSGGHFFLAQRLGPHRAAELIFTGKLITGITAATLGLINRALPAPQLEEYSRQLCRDVAAGPTGAFRASKHILAEARTFEEILELEARSMDAALKGDDGREGLRAFKEKRRPHFIGR